MPSKKLRDEISIPLVVDVDGSLVNGDLLIEGTLRLLATTPFKLFSLPFWLAKGRAALKRRVAQAVSLPSETLVLNPAVLEEIAAAKAAGRQVWLASAADELAVAPLTERLGATGHLTSNGRTNMVGETKAATLVRHFGAGGFDYIGNEWRDLVVWKQARRAIGINLSARLARKVRRVDAEARFLPGLDRRPRDYLRALRPHQWSKNVLVFVPLVAAHEIQASLYLLAAGLFVALSAVASGTYLLNDLLDLPHDRRHERKRHRPLAAGTVPLLPMIGVGPALAVGGLGLAWSLSALAGMYILLYLLVTLAYSLSLKHKTFLDVITLALLFAIRVLAGAAVVHIELSPWFLAFFTFVFLSLAIVKRQSELRALQESGWSAVGGRAYVTADLPVLTAFGAASGMAAVVVFALYIQTVEVSKSYSRPECLWLICPLLIYWLGRMTLLANRGAVDEDPVTFALSDRTSWLTGVGVLAAFTVAL